MVFFEVHTAMENFNEPKMEINISNVCTKVPSSKNTPA